MDSKVINKTKSICESHKNGETVILNLFTGYFFGVQDTSESIWQLIDGNNTKHMIVDIMLEKYSNVSRKEMEKDVEEILALLKEKELIV